MTLNLCNKSNFPSITRIDFSLCLFHWLAKTYLQPSQASNPSPPTGFCFRMKTKLSSYGPVQLWTTPSYTEKSLCCWLLAPWLEHHEQHMVIFPDTPFLFLLYW